MQTKSMSVYGVGTNDASYPVHLSKAIEGRIVSSWKCPFYRAWNNMLTRCYSEKEHKRRPIYIGCSVVREWHSFSAFRGWMVEQQWEGNHLDKDILSPGNKVYGPDTCVFVPGKLNGFIVDQGGSRGEWPLGVHWRKDAGKFRAGCSNPLTGKCDHLGYFDTPEEAHEAWRARKHELACKYADQQSDPRIAAALRTRYANNTGETK